VCVCVCVRVHPLLDALAVGPVALDGNHARRPAAAVRRLEVGAVLHEQLDVSVVVEQHLDELQVTWHRTWAGRGQWPLANAAPERAALPKGLTAPQSAQAGTLLPYAQGGSTLKWVWVSLLVFLGAKMTAWHPHVTNAVLHTCYIYYGELKFKAPTVTWGCQGVIRCGTYARFLCLFAPEPPAAGAQAW
jgi:hypothetical protein